MPKFCFNQTQLNVYQAEPTKSCGSRNIHAPISFFQNWIHVITNSYMMFLASITLPIYYFALILEIFF